MSWGNCIGTSLTPRVASAAMAMLTARTEPQYHFVGFSNTLVPLNINSTQRLDTVIRTIDQVNAALKQIISYQHYDCRKVAGNVLQSDKRKSVPLCLTYSLLFPIRLTIDQVNNNIQVSISNLTNMNEKKVGEMKATIGSKVICWWF